MEEVQPRSNYTHQIKSRGKAAKPGTQTLYHIILKRPAVVKLTGTLVCYTFHVLHYTVSSQHGHISPRRSLQLTAALHATYVS